MQNRVTAARAALLAAGLAALWAIWAAALLLPGELRIDEHEADTLHLADIVLRIAQGQWPHLDFMTPLGWATAAPIAGFVASGSGIGFAILQAQAAVGLALLPVVWWIGVSRLGGGWLALGFGALVLTLVMALVHGGSAAPISVSMHYNRWAWGVAFCALALSLLPPARPRPLPEGVLAGLLMSALALMKVTYVVAFLPAIVVALLLRGEARTVLIAVATGLAVIVAMTLAAGLQFWPAYLGDLIAVAGSDSRAEPGMPIDEVITAPAYVGGSVLAILAVILLRRAGHAREGLLLLLVVPGFFLVTWQNFGNDPQWLPFLAVLLLALRPTDPDRARPLAAAALLALAFGLPSMINTAQSPFRHLARQDLGYVPLLPAATDHGDLLLLEGRSVRLLGQSPIRADPDADRTELNGEALPACALRAGVPGWYAGLAEGLGRAEGGGAIRPALLADTQPVLWLYGGGPPLPGGAPWYYGGLPGGAAADLLVVPLCPISQPSRAAILGEVAEAGWRLREIARDDLAVYLEIVRGAAPQSPAAPAAQDP